MRALLVPCLKTLMSSYQPDRHHPHSSTFGLIELVADLCEAVALKDAHVFTNGRVVLEDRALNCHDDLSQFWASAWVVMWVVPVKGMGVRAVYFAEHSSGVSPQ